MPVAGGGFELCYNAQAVVAAGSLLVVAADVVQAPNDKRQLTPMLETGSQALSAHSPCEKRSPTGAKTIGRQGP